VELDGTVELERSWKNGSRAVPNTQSRTSSALTCLKLQSTRPMMRPSPNPTPVREKILFFIGKKKRRTEIG
jgi:hypothetical protein